MVDILVVSVRKVLQISCAEDGGIVLIAGIVGGNGNVAASFGKSELHHAGGLIGYGIGFQHFKGGKAGL